MMKKEGLASFNCLARHVRPRRIKDPPEIESRTKKLVEVLFTEGKKKERLATVRTATIKAQLCRSGTQESSPNQRTLDRTSTMTPGVAETFRVGRYSTDHRQDIGSKKHKAEPAEIRPRMMCDEAVVVQVREGGLWCTTNPVRPDLLSESG